MSDTLENLNYDFNYNLFIAKTLISNLAKHEDKTRATRWMKKLSTCNRTANEIRLRNDFMYYLIVNIQQGELQPPFNENPPQKPLPSIAHLLVSRRERVWPFANEISARGSRSGCRRRGWYFWKGWKRRRREETADLRKLPRRGGILGGPTHPQVRRVLLLGCRRQKTRTRGINPFTTTQFIYQ